MTAATVIQPDALDAPLSDEELAAVALAADPGVEVDPDAVCVWDLLGLQGRGDLPEWYMPVPVTTGSRAQAPGWHRRLSMLLIVSLLLIDACGLCVTYGPLVWA